MLLEIFLMLLLLGMGATLNSQVRMPSNHNILGGAFHHSGRNRRSAPMKKDVPMPFNHPHKREITWRLAKASEQMPLDNQIKCITAAFRLFSEIAPIIFREDLDHRPDIGIYFYKYSHPPYARAFDGFGRSLAHSWLYGDIHIDDSERFSCPIVDHTDGIATMNLQLVMAHEIGHVLGLLEAINYVGSIMRPQLYFRSRGETDVQLNKRDRTKVQELYGRCQITFDAVVSLRQQTGDLAPGTVIFFKEKLFWNFLPPENRPEYGGARNINETWKGVPDHIDAYINIYEYRRDDHYFIKDDLIYRFNIYNKQVYSGWPYRLRDFFGVLPGQTPIHDNLDAAFYDLRNVTFYFFYGEWVDVYIQGRTETKRISEAFPVSEQSAKRGPVTRVDAVLKDHKDNQMYIISGNHVWLNKPYQLNFNNKWRGHWRVDNSNELHYVGETNLIYPDMCMVKTKWYILVPVPLVPRYG